MTVDRQLVLGGTGVLLLIAAVTLLWPASQPSANAPAAGQQAPARAQQGSSKPGEAQAGQPVGAVKLAALAVSREGPGEARRNPFRFQPKAGPAPTRPVGTPTPVMETPRPVPTPQGPPPVPPIPLKLIGVLERANGVKWAILSDGKNAPMYGKDGDIVDGRYQIVKIGTESVEMTYTDGRGRTVIRLTGQ